MKKIIFCTMTLVLLLFALASCGYIDNHVYSGPCDTTCNDCDFGKREPEAEHTYNNCADTKCAVCGDVRENPGEHTFKSNCDTTCDACGLTRTSTEEHVYDSPCDVDCNACGDVRAADSHIYDNACDTDCNFCGALRATNHVYSNSCDKTCNVCGGLRIPSAHVYSNNCDTSCDICGELRMVPNHVYSSICDDDCNACGEPRIAQPHTYDHNCDTDCNVCGNVRVVADHSYDNACDSTCNSCGQTRENAHSFGDWKQKTAPTCVNAEVVIRTCAVCGEEELADGADALGHDFTNDCDTACNRAKCGFRRTIEHTYIAEFAIKIPATCTTDAVENRFCDICGYEEKRIVENTAFGHHFGDVDLKPNCDPDCNEPGCGFMRKPSHYYDNEEDLSCNECGAMRNCPGHEALDTDCTRCRICYDVIDGWEHTFDGDFIQESAANCTDPEYLYKVCSVCGCESERVEGEAALDHLWDDACDTDCNRPGCGEERTITHDYKWQTKTPATCYDPEVQEEVCDVCGAHGAEQTIEGVLSHEYANACDATCELCEEVTREAPHVYADEHDVTCEECDHIRPCNGHAALEDDCLTCQYCGGTIEGAMHTYDNECDAECNECGKERTVGPHVPSGTDCTKCTYCDATIAGAAHEATDEDCTVCKNCDTATGIEHIASDDDCAACKNCDQASGEAHTPHYGTNCTKCEICGKDSGTAHKDSDSDGICDKCPKETLPGENWFPWAPL